MLQQLRGILSPIITDFSVHSTLFILFPRRSHDGLSEGLSDQYFRLLIQGFVACISLNILNFAVDCVLSNKD